MANSITINGTFTLASDTVRSVGTLATSANLVGANYIAENINVTGSAYTALNTSSLQNVGYGFFSNQDVSASIVVALDNAGTNKVLVIRPYTETTWAFTGSIATVPLFAKALNTTGSVVLEYILTEE